MFFAPSQTRRDKSVFFFPEWISSRISLNHHFIVWIYIEMCYTMAMQHWIGRSRTCFCSGQKWKDWRFIETPRNCQQTTYYINCNETISLYENAQNLLGNNLVAIQVSFPGPGYKTSIQPSPDEVLGRANSSFTALTYLPQETLQQRWPLDSMAEVKVRDSDSGVMAVVKLRL